MGETLLFISLGNNKGVSQNGEAKSQFYKLGDQGEIPFHYGDYTWPLILSTTRMTHGHFSQVSTCF